MEDPEGRGLTGSPDTLLTTCGPALTIFRHGSVMRRQPVFIDPEVNQRLDCADHAEGRAVQRVLRHEQPADMATRHAADLSAAVAVGRAAPWAGIGKLLERVSG